MEIVTGYRGTNHVTAEQLGDLQAGYVGYEECVLDIGEKLRAEAVTANKVRVFDGTLLMYGRQAIIEAGAYEDLEIENGTPGMYRKDAIVARYIKDESTGIEDIQLAVLKGHEGSGYRYAPIPTPISGNIRDGAFEHEMLLYTVELEGLAVVSVEPQFLLLTSMAKLEEKVNDINSNLAKPVHDNLWSGTAGDGQTITLSKSIYDYNMIYFSNDTDGIRAMFPVANGVTAIRAGGSTVTTAGNTATFGVTGDVSNEGKTIKITNVAYMTHIASGNNSALTTRKITRVFGLR